MSNILFARIVCLEVAYNSRQLCLDLGSTPPAIRQVIVALMLLETSKRCACVPPLSHPGDKMSLFMQYVVRLEEIAPIWLRTEAAGDWNGNTLV